MTAPPTDATKLDNVYGFYRMGKGDLATLFAKAAGAPQVSHVTVSTVHDRTTRAAGSLPELINNVTSMASYDRHIPWDNLKFEGKAPHGELQIKIDIGPRITVEVEGTNEALVHGQMARIELFLLSRGAKKEGRPHTIQLLLGMLTAAFASHPAPLAPYCAAFMAVTFFVSLYNGRRKLMILEDIPMGTAWIRFTSVEKATVAGAYIAALAAVGAVASGVTDVLGAIGE
ncbi:hypothetical protein [Streptomyces sp. NPDC052042]|uniref:hypothetical protein n=1 Tax=Streptomyces sp. NPDC052042 TaxID=3365683 RepID=UPI0037D1291F